MVTQKKLRTLKRKQVYNFFNNFKLPTVVDFKKCLKQIKFPISIHKFAPISELPLYKSNMYCISSMRLNLQ